MTGFYFAQSEVTNKLLESEVSDGDGRIAAALPRSSQRSKKKKMDDDFTAGSGFSKTSEDEDSEYEPAKPKRKRLPKNDVLKSKKNAGKIIYI